MVDDFINNPPFIVIIFEAIQWTSEFEIILKNSLVIFTLVSSKGIISNVNESQLILCLKDCTVFIHEILMSIDMLSYDR